MQALIDWIIAAVTNSAPGATPPTMEELVQGILRRSIWFLQAKPELLERLDSTLDAVSKIATSEEKVGTMLSLHFVRQLYLGTEFDITGTTQGGVFSFDASIYTHLLERMHANWFALPEENRPLHPLAPLVREWLKRPRHVDAETKAGVLPARIAHHTSDDRFSLPEVLSENKQMTFNLPGIRGSRRAALPIELFRIGYIENRGRGAPIAQRLFVAGLMKAPLGNRSDINGVTFTLTARELLKLLYPDRKPNKRWRAVIEQGADDLWNAGRIEYVSPSTGARQLLRPVLLADTPLDMDGIAHFVIQLPEGDDRGTIAPMSLMSYGVNNPRAFNALLNLAYHWHQPGTTVVPVRDDDGRRRWARAYDWERYEPYNRDEIIDLTQPLSQNTRRRDAFRRGLATLKELDAANELDIIEVGRDEYKIRPHKTDKDK